MGCADVLLRSGIIEYKDCRPEVHKLSVIHKEFADVLVSVKRDFQPNVISLKEVTSPVLSASIIRLLGMTALDNGMSSKFVPLRWVSKVISKAEDINFSYDSVYGESLESQNARASAM